VPDRFPTWSWQLPGIYPVRASKCPQIARLQIGPRHYAGKKKEYKEYKEFEEFKNAEVRVLESLR